MSRSSPQLPLRATSRVSANYGFMVLAAIGLVGLGQLAAPPPSFGAFVHSNGMRVLIMVLSLMTAPLFFIRRQTLIIDEKGISLENARSRYVYIWNDITDISKNGYEGVRLSIAGQTQAQNIYNVVPARFGFSQHQLVGLVQEGVDRWGVRDAGAPTGRSFTPGDEARKIVKSQFSNAVLLFALPFIALAIFILVPAIISTMEDITLARRGVRAEATVVRLYTGDCSKNGCLQKVQYTFQPAEAAHPEIGYERLGVGKSDEMRHKAYAETLGVVPVIYDPKSPDHFRLNFDESVFLGHPWRGLFALALILGSSQIALYALFIFIAWNAWRKSNKQLPPDKPRPAHLS